MTEEFVANFTLESNDPLQAEFKLFPDFVTLNTEQTITHKTIDADDNVIKDLQVSNFKAGVVRTVIRSAESASDSAIATEKAIRTLFNEISLPPAIMLPYGGSVVPDGWLPCLGACVLKSTYSRLYAEIGDTYGTPTSADVPEGADPNDYFMLPDFRNRTFWGGDTTNVGTIKDAGLPNISGTLYSVYTSRRSNEGGEEVTGVFGVYDSQNMTRDGGGSASDAEFGISFDASKSSNIYKDDVTTVQPPAIQTMFIIKY